MILTMSISLDRSELTIEVPDDLAQKIIDGEVIDLSEIIDKCPRATWDDVYNDLQCVVDDAWPWKPRKARGTGK